MAGQLTLEEMKAQQEKFYEEEEKKSAEFKEADKDFDADGLLKEIEEQGKEEPATSDPDPILEPVQEPDPVKPSAEVQELQKRYDELEHRFKVLEGMYKKDKLVLRITELEDIVDALKEKNAGLVSELDKLQDVKSEPPIPDVKPDAKQQETLDKLAERFGVEPSDIHSLSELVEQVTGKMVKEKLESLGKELGDVKESVNKSEHQIYKERLTDPKFGVEDALYVIDDPKFSDWLKDNLMYESVYIATQKRDATSVIKAIRKYKEATAPKADPEEEAAEAERKRALDEMAQPEKGKGGKPPKPDKKTYTAADVAAYSKRYLNRDPALYQNGLPKPAAKALFEDMKAASTEGRIISP